MYMCMHIYIYIYIHKHIYIYVHGGRSPGERVRGGGHHQGEPGTWPAEARANYCS